MERRQFRQLGKTILTMGDGRERKMEDKQDKGGQVGGGAWRTGMRDNLDNLGQLFQGASPNRATRMNGKEGEEREGQGRDSGGVVGVQWTVRGVESGRVKRRVRVESGERWRPVPVKVAVERRERRVWRVR